MRGSNHPAIAEAIAHALERSSLFQQLVTSINSTDGIVYVHHGRCVLNVLACLLRSVTQAGRYRILHIKVEGRKKGNDLIVAIGHELQHAIEILSQPGIVDSDKARIYYNLVAPTNGYSHETQAALQTELNIAKELREWAKKRLGQDGARRPFCPTAGRAVLPMRLTGSSS